MSITASEIFPNLWIGNISDAGNVEWIEKNIDIVINCTNDIPFSVATKSNVRIPVEDDLTKSEISKLYKYFDSITTFMDSSLRRGKRILIHCFAGKQRSASIVCAFLIRFLELNISSCVALLQTRRSIVFEPACNFHPALLRWELNCVNHRKNYNTL